MNPRHRLFIAPRRAFTLIELLVVIAIIGTLVALLLPAMGMVREASRRSQCTSNLHQVGLALNTFHTAKSAYPVGCLDRFNRRLSWNCWLLPYLEESARFNQLNFQKPYNSAANRAACGAVLPVFLCPSTARWAFDRAGDTTGDRNHNGQWDPGDDLGFTDYGGMFGAANVEPFMNGVLVWDMAISQRQITDGLHYTIIVAEDTGRGPSADGEWSNGENVFDVAGPINKLQDNEIWSDHPGGACVLFCDGRAEFLSAALSIDVLNKLCTRNGDELVSGDELYP
ncbi:MAG TPA: DUF1559 domain-containing protein [Pirellulales bacterium]|nr:DUF1559 domain-containing protein [Pirellulales bacterium]